MSYETLDLLLQKKGLISGLSMPNNTDGLNNEQYRYTLW